MTYPHGLFSWTDISLPDPAAGRAFYTELFDWDAEDQHDPEGNYIYTMFSKAGKAVAGLGPLQTPSDEGHPPMWLLYVTVDDLDATVDTWVRMGGSTLSPPMDVMSAGRMALVADPQGAVLALWQAGEHVGGEVFGEHGAMAWTELHTRDAAASREFYTAALGWDFEPLTGQGPPGYLMIRLDAKTSGQPYRDDDYNGGVLTMDENWPETVPPHWMVYFHVDDTDELVERLTKLGGSVSVPPFGSAAGRIAVVGDPQGGTFSVIAPSQSAG